MPSSFWSQIIELSFTVTQQVGAQLLQEYGQVQATTKNDGSLVTRCDRWADQTIGDAIATIFPSHGLLTEEGIHQFPGQDWCWIIDPIDGTTNFTRGIPIWAISLGLLYRGTPVFGYVHLPPLGQTFHGFWNAPDHANGAFLNEVPIQTRTEAPASNQFFSLCARSITVLQQPFPCKIRMLGSAAYNLLTVAAGMTLGAVEATPKIWDIAAVWPIVHAAGGAWQALEPDPVFPLRVGHSYGDRPYPTLVVSQAQWLPEFMPLVQCVSSNPCPIL
jgi:myo-inositol-1(or 4)-monophosphatase